MEIAYTLRNLNKRSGISRSVVELMTRASKDKDIEKVHWIGYKTEWNPPDSVVQHRTDLIEPTNMFDFPLMIHSNANQNTRIAEKLKEENPETIIHSQGAESRTQDILHAQSCHKRAVETDMKDHGMLYNAFKSIKHFATLSIEVKNYTEHRFKKVIAVSNQTKQELIEEYKVPEEDIAVIPHGIDTEEFHPRNKMYRSEIRQKHGIGEDELLIMWAGYEPNRKGLNPLIDAMLSMDAKLIVLGWTPEKGRYAEFKDEIIFAGKTDQMPKYYGTADMFVFPTLYEPQGLVCMESLATGIPVITSRVCGATELMREGKDSLWLDDPKDPEEIIEKIKEAAGKLETMGGQARKTAEKYTWNKTYNQVKKVYEEVARRG